MSLSQVPWQVLVVTSSLVTSLSIVVNKHQSHKASALQVQSLKYLSASVFIGLVWWFISKNIPLAWWQFYIYGMAVGINVTIYTQAQRISLSKTALVGPIGELLGVILAAIVLKEWRLFTSSRGLYLILALILMPAVFWFFYEVKEISSKKWIKTIAVFLSILAVFKVITKTLLDKAPEAIEMLMFLYFGAFTATFIGLKIKRYKMFVNKRFAIKGILQGIIAGSGTLLIFAAIKQATVVQTTLLRVPLLLIVTTLSGLIGFKELEKMNAKKWIGTIVAGLIMILVLLSTQQ